MNKFSEKFMNIVFFISALVSILAVLLICFFLFGNSISAISKIGLFEFLFGKEWSPTDVPPMFGIFPMILGSIYITAGAIIIGVPIGIFTAVFLARICPKKILQYYKTRCRAFGGNPFGCLRIFCNGGNSANFQK